MPKKKKTKKVVVNIVSGPTPTSLGGKKLVRKNVELGPDEERQLTLFAVETQKEINGVEMGVLSDGTPYLTESGLARLCGVDRKVLNRLAANWTSEQNKPRGQQIRSLLEKYGHYEDSLFLKSTHRGTEINAYTEYVCLAIIAYYAFIAEEKREAAQTAMIDLARFTFRAFIYENVGYQPKIPDYWRHYHDRLDKTKNAVPDGYFCIFQEIACIIIPMISKGIKVDQHTVPDISVGRKWSDFWKKNGLEAEYGSATHYSHNYPDYFPQAKSNPQMAKAYPDEALAEFRRWFREDYQSESLPLYLVAKAKKGDIDLETASGALEAITGQRLLN